jgi:hypothetical protein
MNEHEIENALKALGEEEIAEAEYAELRRRVLARVRAGRRTAWWWSAAAAAVVAVLSANALWRPRPAPHVPPRQEARAPVLIPAMSPPPHRTPARVKRARAVKPAAAEPLLVKMLTDDPDIVIYWLVDRNGELE